MSRAITCPNCGGTIGVKAAGYTVSVACLHCGTLLDVANPDVKVIADYHQGVAALDLPLGSRGTVFGVEWEAIGWLERESAGYVWQEYLLFNPYAGYRWLVESGGQWQFGQMLTGLPAFVRQGVWGWAGRTFRQEDEGATLTTRRVLGEFYWRVRAGDTVHGESFASEDGQTLSMEAVIGSGDDEVQWTHLVPVPQRWIDGFTRPTGPDAAHPGGARPSSPPPAPGFFTRMRQGWADLPWFGENDLIVSTLLASATGLIAWILLGLPAQGSFQAAVDSSVAVDGPEAHITVGHVHASRAMQFVTIQVSSTDFINRWVDFDFLLVDRATQQAIPASATLEYYQGRDSDGTWAEGSHQHSTLIASVPRGDYELVASAEAKSWHDPSGFAPIQSTPTPDATSSPWAVDGAGVPNGSGAAPAEVLPLHIEVSTGGDNTDLRLLIAALAFVLPGWLLVLRWGRN